MKHQIKTKRCNSVLFEQCLRFLPPETCSNVMYIFDCNNFMIRGRIALLNNNNSFAILKINRNRMMHLYTLKIF